VIRQCSGTGRVAALTFDDGPNGSTTTRLLDFLGERGISAVFCVIGKSIEAPGGAELVRRMVDEGHMLGNHTTSHDDMGKWSVDAIESDLLRNLGIIRTALGRNDYPVPYFRAPNGSWGRTSDVAEKLGMRSLAVMNTIDDWITQDPRTLAANLRSAIRPGELVLAHDGGGDREATVDAVISVVTERLAEGWRFTLPVV
jgi:endo-1,4-beta-xylanase